ncbi:MAG: hypothetical protein CMF25_03950 [Kangiellaceae bacterium]|nr:hypothetical protein [Kangiellaceae bacterium]
MAKKLLILDLDETLIHAVEAPLERPHDFETELYYVYKRPYVHEFLEFAKDLFEVAVWTSAGSDFAQTVYENVFGENYELQFMWSRERCTQYFNPEYYNHEYVKNLAKVKRRGYGLEDVIMVDDTPAKLRKNYGNLVRIEEFVGDPADKELLRLQAYLVDLEKEDNMRKVEKRGWASRYSV